MKVAPRASALTRASDSLKWKLGRGGSSDSGQAGGGVRKTWYGRSRGRDWSASPSEPKKVLISVILGGLGFAWSFFTLNFSVPPFSLSINWFDFLPLLAGMAFGGIRSRGQHDRAWGGLSLFCMVRQRMGLPCHKSLAGLLAHGQWIHAELEAKTPSFLESSPSGLPALRAGLQLHLVRFLPHRDAVQPPYLESQG